MKLAWVEIDCCSGLAIRIFKSRKLMVMAMPYAEDGCSKQMSRAEAVKQIRQQIFSRQQGRCEDCNRLIYWETMHLHERQHRGSFKISPAIAGALNINPSLSIEKSGEVSLENSVALCVDCHQVEHSDRQVRLGV